VVESLRHDPRVAFAELDYAVHAVDVRPSTFDIRHSGVITPNDPEWSKQWNLKRIQLPEAWNVVTGTPDVVIAVLDTGVQLEHEDLASQVWTNPGEISGNDLDDDGNGKVDDVHGWHFFHRWEGGAYIPDEDANVRDDNGHGTHVSGIATAAANNGVGIAGIAWGARIMPVKVLNEFGDGFLSDTAAGLIYAADNGARIINLSLGTLASSTTLIEAVDYARQHGALVIAATGNDGLPMLRYPAAYDPVLAVAATDENDQWATFSNYGPQVDLAAPGTNIYSTWCRQDLYLKSCSGDYYFAKSGTSMAAPHVSGIAALIWSLRPELSSSQVISRLLETADDTGSPGPDPYTGWGRHASVAGHNAVRHSVLGRNVHDDSGDSKRHARPDINGQHFGVDCPRCLASLFANRAQMNRSSLALRAKST
jgi:subtilisin family serine protease